MFPHRTRRPDFTDTTSMTWRLFTLFGLHVDLCVVFYSDDPNDDRPADHSTLMILLKGVVRFNKSWIEAIDAVIERAGQRSNLQLPPSQTYEECLFDLPWMEQPDIKYDCDRRAWLLVISKEKP